MLGFLRFTIRQQPFHSGIGLLAIVSFSKKGRFVRFWTIYSRQKVSSKLISLTWQKVSPKLASLMNELISTVIISSIYKAVSEHERPTISGYCFSLRLKANIRQNKKGMLLCIPFNRSLFLNLCHIVSIDQQNHNKPYAGIFDIAYYCLTIAVP